MYGSREHHGSKKQIPTGRNVDHLSENLPFHPKNCMNRLPNVAIESGYPLLQALILHHPEDKLCWHVDDEYYFGNDFLVAPVMNSENRRDIYLPEGKWVNFFTGERLEGACWLKDVYVPLEEMPVYVRANAVIPIYPEDVDCTDEMDLSKSMALRIDNDYKGFWTMIDCGRKLINLV